MKILLKSYGTCVLKLFNLLIAVLTWPKFSLTSFKMVSDLGRQGILPNTVIDVGANVGQFAVSSAKLFSHAKVYSFEPNPQCVTLLRNNVKSLTNISVFPVALGDIVGELNFHVNAHSHSSSLLPLAKHHRGAFPDAKEVDVISVEVSTLDSVFSNLTLKEPVLLKLDVQGYESQALRGGRETLKRVDFVVLEVSFKPMYEGELLFFGMIELMATFGFEFLRPVGWLSDPFTGEFIQIDALFCRKA